MTVYVLCCWGGPDGLDPLIAVFNTQKGAHDYCLSLPPIQGAAWFIERHTIGEPSAYAEVEYGYDDKVFNS